MAVLTPIWGKLDTNIAPLVRLLRNEWGINTVGSCGGHRKPKRIQQAEGEWFVSFSVGIEDMSRLLALIDALEYTGVKYVSMRLSWLSGCGKVVNGSFHGDCEPGALIEALRHIKAVGLPQEVKL